MFHSAITDAMALQHLASDSSMAYATALGVMPLPVSTWVMVIINERRWSCLTPFDLPFFDFAVQK